MEKEDNLEDILSEIKTIISGNDIKGRDLADEVAKETGHKKRNANKPPKADILISEVAEINNGINKIIVGETNLDDSFMQDDAMQADITRGDAVEVSDVTEEVAYSTMEEGFDDDDDVLELTEIVEVSDSDELSEIMQDDAARLDSESDVEVGDTSFSDIAADDEISVLDIDKMLEENITLNQEDIATEDDIIEANINDTKVADNKATEPDEFLDSIDEMLDETDLNNSLNADFDNEQAVVESFVAEENTAENYEGNNFDESFVADSAFDDVQEDMSDDISQITSINLEEKEEAMVASTDFNDVIDDDNLNDINDDIINLNDNMLEQNKKTSDDSLISSHSANKTSEIIKGLVNSVPKPRIESPEFRSGNNVEDLVVEALKPMLKEWLDKNLEQVVANIVEKEIKKILPK